VNESRFPQPNWGKSRGICSASVLGRSEYALGARQSSFLRLAQKKRINSLALLGGLSGRQDRHVIALKNPKPLAPRLIESLFEFWFDGKPFVNEGAQGILDNPIARRTSVGLTEVQEITVQRLWEWIP